jgi:hypothetical protein
MASNGMGTTLVRALKVLRTERVAGVTAIGIVGVLMATVAGLGGRAHSVLPTLRDIGAWLSNDQKGSVTHANGVASKPDATVPLSNAAGHKLIVTQDGDIVIVTDTVTGTATRIDAGQLRVVQSANYGSPAVQIVAGAGRAYAIDPVRGVAQPIDPNQLTTLGAPVALTPPISGAGLDAAGTLWLALPGTGEAASVIGDRAAARIPIGSPGDTLMLTIAGGVPVLTDATAGTVTVLPASGARQTVNLPLPGGSGVLLAPTATDGAVVPLLAKGSQQIVIVDTATGRPTAVALDGLTGHDLGTPQALGGRVYVPDNTTGRLIVYDTASGRTLNQVAVGGGPGRIELFTRDGVLWANDAQGSAAVSIDSSGTVTPVSKYTTDLPGGSLPSIAPSASANPRAPGGGPGVGGRAPGHNNGGTGGNPRGGSGGGGSGGGGSGGSGNTPPPSPRPPSPAPPAPPPPPAPPNAATNIGETPGPGYVDVKFSPAAGATPSSYTLSGVPSGATVTPSRVTGSPYRFRVTGLSCGAPYTFKVVANYPTAALSASGGSARACLPPGAPRNLNLDTGTSQQITASWQAPADEGGGSVTYTAQLDGNGATGVGGATSHLFTGVSNFNSHTVTVTAKNAAGRSQPPASTSKRLEHAPWHGTTFNNSLAELYIRQSPTTNSAIQHTFAANTSNPVTVVCQATGGAWHDFHDPNLNGNTWYKVSSPATGYMATGYVTGVSGVWPC